MDDFNIYYDCPECGTPITDDPDCEEGELCCACETELIHAKQGIGNAKERPDSLT